MRSSLLSGQRPGEPAHCVHVLRGRYQNGLRHFMRVWNCDQAVRGLNLSSFPPVLHVHLANC